MNAVVKGKQKGNLIMCCILTTILTFRHYDSQMQPQ